VLVPTACARRHASFLAKREEYNDHRFFIDADRRQAPYAASDSSGRLIPGIGPITEQQIRDKLTADGFSNIQITSQGSIFQTNATKDGRALRLAIDAESGAVLQAQDDDDDD
jgi:hypothetical protein